MEAALTNYSANTYMPRQYQPVQLVPNGNFVKWTGGNALPDSWENGSYYITTRATITQIENGIDFVFTETNSNYVRMKFTDSFKFKNGHGYYIKFGVIKDSGIDVACGGTSGANYRVASGTSAQTTLTSIENIKWLTGDSTMEFGIGFPSGVTAGKHVQIYNLMCIDLTETFGAGNEPSTAADARTKFAAVGFNDVYYPFYNNQPVQVVGNGNFNGVTGWSAYQSNTTRSASDNVLTIERTSSATNAQASRPMVTRLLDATIPSGHKFYYSYWQKYTIASPYTSKVIRNMFLYTPTQWCPGTLYTDDDFADWKHISGVVAASADRTRIYVGRYGNGTNYPIAVGDKVQIKNVMVFDLTAMYGAGQEPTTAGAVEALWPNEYYETNTIPWETMRYNLMPLAKAEYTDDATFKSTFYVDDTWYETDSSGNQVVMGLVTPNGDNYNHHGYARIGHLHIMKSGVDRILLNDGGLNTRPHAEFYSTDPRSAITVKTTTQISARCNLKSAYYLDTTSFDLHLYKNGTLVTEASLTPNSGSATVPAQGSYTNYTGTLTPSGLRSGDTVTLTISGTNDEGTYTNPTSLTFTVS